MTDAFPTSTDVQIDLAQSQLHDAGIRLVIGSVVNPSGITLAKSVPVSRMGAFQRSGVGAAPAWDVFCIDGGIALNDKISAVGDLRLRIDVANLRNIGGGQAWAPANMYSQAGAPHPSCARGTLGRIQTRIEEAGFTALVGHELEFVLVASDGSALTGSSWVPYGLSGLLERESFLADLLLAMNEAGVQLEQLHSEYGHNQFEFSLPPENPLAAADTVVLAKIIVGRVARAHGIQASFSPAPFLGDVGSGAHQHFSLARNGESLFAGGDGPHGITAEGGAAIGGIIDGLPEVQGLLTGSVLSGIRLAPGTWSGAYSCWGLENREASVRFLNGGISNPHGANIEVKIIDPAANVYLASAAILALALDGIQTGKTLPSEISGDPGALSDDERAAAGVRILSDSPKEIIDVLDNSAHARALLGDAVIDVTVAARRHEQESTKDATPEELADRFRLSWSI